MVPLYNPTFRDLIEMMEEGGLSMELMKLHTLIQKSLGITALGFSVIDKFPKKYQCPSSLFHIGIGYLKTLVQIDSA